MSDVLARAHKAGLGRENVLAGIQDILRDILSLESNDTLKPEAHLRDDLQIDSLGMVDIVIGIEQNFGIKISSDINLFERTETVADAVELILELTAAKS